MQPFEVQEIPKAISEYLLRSNKKSDNRKPNHYWISDICKCLRQSYYEITLTPHDNDSGISVEQMWLLHSRKLLHGLTYAYKWRELDVEKEFHLPNIREPVFLRGRLDMYDYNSQTILDLKTSNAIKWQLEQGIIPRVYDIDQVQCYGSLFDSVIKVSNLTLVYADMRNLVAIGISLVDRSDWIKARLFRLHQSLAIAKVIPPAEPSNSCDFCPYRQRCNMEI